MKKLMSLLKAAMSQDMSVFKIIKQDQGKVSKFLLPIFLSLIVMFSVGYYAYMIAEELSLLNLTYIVLSMFMIVTALLTLVEGIYKSQGILFDAKDNDLLFSLPIKKEKIFFLRIFKLLAFDFLYNALFLLPAMIVYAIIEAPGVSYYLISLLILLLSSIIPTILASIIGYIIKGISNKFKAKNIVQVVITSLMLVLVFYVSLNMQSFIENIGESAKSINDIITKLYYPAGLYINLIQNFNVLDLIILLLINIIPTILFIYLASIFYFKIIFKGREKSSNKLSKQTIDKKKRYKDNKPLNSLLKKELQKFFATPVLIINAGFGLVLMVIITIALAINFDGMATALIQEEGIGLSLGQIKAIIPKIYYAILLFTTCMTSITSSMISLEGKSFNMTKSLPIAPEKIILSKILTSLVITLPVLILSNIIFFIRFSVSIIDIIFILLASIIMPIFTAMVGILMNLKYPKLDAATDTEIVKQSMSSFVSVFLGIIFAMVLIGMLFLSNKLNINLIILIELLVMSIVVFILWKVIKNYGVNKWHEMSI